MECEVCKNKFSSKPNLIHHQKTAGYCLKMRDSTEYKKSYICEFCKKEYTSKFRLTTHLIKCLENSSELIELRDELKLIKNSDKNSVTQISFLYDELKKRDNTIKDLQKQIENIAIQAVKRPTTSNRTNITNYIQNMKPVTDEHLLDNVQHLTIEHIKKGVEGYAEYALEYPLKDRLICSDFSRRKVKFKDNDGNVITDPEMNTLARKFFHSIKEKNKELICRSANELKEKLGDDNVMETVVKMFDYKSDIEKGSDGEKTDFHHDFVKQVCSHTVKE
jgi:hypothetical protein